MPTTPCVSCGLPRADDLVGLAPCPLCGSDGSPPPPAPEPIPAPAPLPQPSLPPRPRRAVPRFGLGLAAGLLIGVGAGAGGTLGWQARPAVVQTALADPGSDPSADPPTDSPFSPPLPPVPAQKTPLPTAVPTGREKPASAGPSVLPGLVLDNPDGETRPFVRPGGHLVLSGKVKRLVIPGLSAGAVLDATRVEAGEVVIAGAVDGGSRLVVRAERGVVMFRGPVGGGSVVQVTARSVGFEGAITGPNTRAVVTLTAGGELVFASLDGPARLEYRRANPGDPTPKLRAGRVAPPGMVTEVQ